jgi:toxin YoeB
MRYKLILMPEAERHLQEWRKSGQKKTLLKIAALLEELCEHPTTGTGKVEQLLFSAQFDLQKNVA